ncbi:MAG TPA: thiamine pyrophosphate-dependent enzyme [Acidobacteriota bacterium]|nr:thiamine pyrophosphate-dependent enzyme [Acidobacteriota bacterium]
MLTKDELLLPLARLREDRIVVTTMSVVRPWARHSQSDLDFASADSAMGHAADLALGLALAQPERGVVCVNGDGSMLMSLGTLATIVDSGATNLTLLVVDNRTYEITGNQPWVAADSIDFCALAQAVGFRRTYAFEDADQYEHQLPEVLGGPGPVLVSVRVEPGTEGPLSRRPTASSPYLRVSLRESARRLRGALRD